MTNKKPKVPLFLYRGESDSHIQEYGKLTFPKEGKELKELPEWRMSDDSGKNTFDYDKNSINDSRDFYTFGYNHADATSPRNSKNYLSFTATFDAALKFATSDPSGLIALPGRVFKIDTRLLPLGEFRRPQVTHNPSYADEEEFGIHALTDSIDIPEAVIIEEIRVSSSGEVIETLKLPKKYEAMQEKIELLEEIQTAETQLTAGLGVSNEDVRAQVLERIKK